MVKLECQQILINFLKILSESNDFMFLLKKSFKIFESSPVTFFKFSIYSHKFLSSKS